MNIIIDKIENESEKPTTPSCFHGAWYHKVFSSKDKWLGIEGTITLPTVNLTRFDESNRNLETSSIYMGGQAKFESDVGLAYMNAQITKDGDISTLNICFRPFWRYITDFEENDAGGYDYERGRNYSSTNLTPNATTSNCYAMYSPKFSEYYYLPGDKIKIIITYPKKDYMQLKIEVIEISNNIDSINLRRKYNWKNPENFESPLFSSPEGDNQLKEFKRVNAIDQRHNEGLPAINTKSSVNNAIWESVYLYREIKNKVYKVPLNNSRSATMNCPLPDAFEYSQIDNKTGASTLNITPYKFIK